MVTRYVYTAGDHTGTPDEVDTLFQYDEAGGLVASTRAYWSLSGSQQHMKGIAVTPGGVVFTAGAATYNDDSDLVTVIKWDADLTPLWYATTIVGSGMAWTVTVLPSGSVLLGRNRSSIGGGLYSSVILLSGADGSILWQKDTGGNVVAVACDASGNCYASGTRVGTKSIWAWEEDGSVLWASDFGATCSGLAVHDSYLFAVGTRNSNLSLRKFALADGAEIMTGGWPVDVGVSTRCVAVDRLGVVYVGYTNTNEYVAAYSTLGIELWKTQWTGAVVNNLALTPEGQIYAGGETASGTDENVRRFDAGSGVENVTGWPVTAGYAVNSVAVTPGLYGAYPDDWMPAANIYVGDVRYE